MPTSNFKTKNTFEKRCSESARICKKYETRVPIIVETDENSSIKLDKSKFLIPYDLSIPQFLYVIRKRIKLTSEQALFVFFNGTIPSATSTIGSVYKQHKDADGFLYAFISLESTFG